MISMKLDSPTAHAVFQRDAKDKAAIPISGSADGPDDTPVEARLAKGKGGKWRRIGRLTGGSFGGALGPVATGGPYDLEVRAGKESARARNLLVGDIYILAGQSNADGCGKLVDCEPPSKMVHCFYYDDRWGVAEDPLCWYNEAVDPVHWNVAEEDHERMVGWDRDFRTFGAGLGVRFGKEIWRRHKVPVGILACSHGGTSLEQWSPHKLTEGGRSLYGSMIRRVKAAGGKAVAMLWYQGESDAATDAGAHYRANMRALIEAVRRDLGMPKLPVLQVQLSTLYGDVAGFPHWNRVQTDQIAVEEDLPNVATAAAVDLELADAIHVGTAGMKTLGVRLAHLAGRLVYGKKSAQIGPRLKSIKIAEDRRSLELRFSGVNRSLAPKKNIVGFTITAGDQQIAMPVRKVKGGSTVVIGLREPLPEGAVLWYGLGHNPAAGLRDEAGLPCPVFGPVEL
jgi:sialate O-acetylesterase